MRTHPWRLRVAAFALEALVVAAVGPVAIADLDVVREPDRLRIITDQGAPVAEYVFADPAISARPRAAWSRGPARRVRASTLPTIPRCTRG